MMAQYSTHSAYWMQQVLFSVRHRGMTAPLAAKERTGSSPSWYLHRRWALAAGFALNFLHARRPKPTARRPERRQARPNAKVLGGEQGTHERSNLLRRSLAAPCSPQGR